MPFRLYNTLTRSVEEFVPADPSNVTFYSCGPTVYDFAHIGNFRSFLLADVLRRWIESPLCELRTDDGNVHQGPRRVRHIMNITDVGHMVDDEVADGGGVDRMEEGARRLTEAKKSGRLPPGAPADIDPDDPFQIAEFYANVFLSDARLLGLKVAREAEGNPALMPRPTRKISQMQAMIRELLENGAAYVVGEAGRAGTAVYFDVSGFPEYGRLSGNTLEALRAGAGGRVSAANQSSKRSPADFLLWKVDPSHTMKWEFPGIGAGYPGWHIECSAMAREALGETIDLHSGGEDNIFPHHECEIAQSRSATGRERFARHWFHVRHLQVEGEKMSKSKGNFYTIRDIVSKGFSPAAIRLELIKTHYRVNANFTEQGLVDSARRVTRWLDTRGPRDSGRGSGAGPFEGAESRFREAMENDFNVASAIAALDLIAGEALPMRQREARGERLSGEDRSALDAASRTIGRMLDVFGLADVSNAVTEVGDGEDAREIESLIGARAAAKKAKDFGEADRIRRQLTDMGIEIKDTAQGTTWSRRASL